MRVERRPIVCRNEAVREREAVDDDEGEEDEEAEYVLDRVRADRADMRADGPGTRGGGGVNVLIGSCSRRGGNGESGEGRIGGAEAKSSTSGAGLFAVSSSPSSSSPIPNDVRILRHFCGEVDPACSSDRLRVKRRRPMASRPVLIVRAAGELARAAMKEERRKRPVPEDDRDDGRSGIPRSVGVGAVRLRTR